jgi:hypothetical protein
MAIPSHDAAHPTDALELLRAEHQKVRQLFQHYEETDDWTTKQQIVDELFTALDIHAQVEETIFYPAFEARATAAGKQAVADNRDEHQTIKEVMEDLRDFHPQDTAFQPKFRELKDNVLHHVEAEEITMFPEAEELLAAQMADLATAMWALQRQLRAS